MIKITAFSYCQKQLLATLRSTFLRSHNVYGNEKSYSQKQGCNVPKMLLGERISDSQKQAFHVPIMYYEREKPILRSREFLFPKCNRGTAFRFSEAEILNQNGGISTSS